MCMSRQFRYRVTAVVLGGLLLGAPLLTNGTASAGQVEGGGRQVVFGGGGVLGLSCRSKPDVGSMTVPAETTVRVVNRTGHSAQLRLGGTAKGTIPDDGSTDVVFRRGTTAVLLDPDCALADESTPVLVTASPSTDPSVTPDPVPSPADSSPATAPSGSDSSSTPSGPGSSLPDSAPATPQGGRTTTTKPARPQRPSTSRPVTGTSTATAGVEAMPQGGSAPRLRTRLTRGTAGAVPAFSGMPPGDHKTLVTDVPSVELPEATTAQAGAAAGATDIAAAEPVAAMEPMSPDQPIGLLAVVAAVCVVGVSVGAIRAFVSQRASRATIA
jgi:hypothetical protein